MGPTDLGPGRLRSHRFQPRPTWAQAVCGVWCGVGSQTSRPAPLLGTPCPGPPLHRTAQNFALFPSPAPIFVFCFLSPGVFSCPCFSLWGFSWNFGCPGPSNTRVFALGLSGLQAAGLSHDSRNVIRSLRENAHVSHK